MQQPLLTLNFIHCDMVRFLPCGNQILTAVIEVKAAWLSFRRLIAFHCQHAAIFRDAEHRNDAGGTIAGVQMTTVRGDVNIRRPAHAGEILRHHIQGLYTFDVAIRVFQLPDVNGAVEFIDAITILLVRMEHHVARTGALDGGHFRRLLSGEKTILAKGKQANTILLQRRHPQGAVVRGDIGRVATFQPFHHGDGFARQAVLQRGHANATLIVGSAEDKAAMMIGRNVGRAAWQRRFPREGQRPVIRRDAIR